MKKTKKPILIISIVILSTLIFTLGIYLGYLLQSTTSQPQKNEINNTIIALQEKIKELQKENEKIKKQLFHKVVNSEIIDYNHSISIIPPPKLNFIPKIAKTEKNKTKKPKLVIIIDDMSFKYQVNLLKQIPYKITPSFFPPTKIHPYTPKLAKQFPHYMVHLPMQALHFNKPEPNTLTINDNYTTILNRIKYIKKTFPNAKFINNHTGSKFTSNLESMILLFKALKTNNLGFVDSVTTAHTKSIEANKYFSIPLFRRNIFLDNKEDANYIRHQLKKAINLAKKYGYAIAIGHPHKVTLLTLKNSKDLLNKVEVVYIDELYKNR